jgi:hypothetical protein
LRQFVTNRSNASSNHKWLLPTGSRAIMNQRRVLKYLSWLASTLVHKMLRAAFKTSIAITSTRSCPSARIVRPSVVLGTRFNSSRTPEQRKASNKAKEELQKDWTAPILTYEEVKQKSKQPSEVRIGFAVHLIDSQSRSRMRI